MIFPGADSGHRVPVYFPRGQLIGDAFLGLRKDLPDAVPHHDEGRPLWLGNVIEIRVDKCLAHSVPSLGR